jgi:hypothetical protein
MLDAGQLDQCHDAGPLISFVRLSFTAELTFRLKALGKCLETLGRTPSPRPIICVFTQRSPVLDSPQVALHINGVHSRIGAARRPA